MFPERTPYLLEQHSAAVQPNCLGNSQKNILQNFSHDLMGNPVSKRWSPERNGLWVLPSIGDIILAAVDTSSTISFLLQLKFYSYAI